MLVTADISGSADQRHLATQGLGNDRKADNQASSCVSLQSDSTSSLAALSKHAQQSTKCIAENCAVHHRHSSDGSTWWQSSQKRRKISRRCNSEGILQWSPVDNGLTVYRQSGRKRCQHDGCIRYTAGSELHQYRLQVLTDDCRLFCRH